MRLSNLWHLYRIRLRARLTQELLAVAGIAVGVALLYSASVATSSLSGSIEQLTRGIIGDARLQLSARAPHGFDATILADVRRLPGVRSAIPVLDAPAVASGPSGRRAVVLIGGDPRSVRLGGTLLRTFGVERLARARAVALPAPIAHELSVSLLTPVRIEVAGRAARAPVVAQLTDADVGELVDSPVVLAPLAYAQELTVLQGRLTRIYVEPSTGRDAEVRAALQRLARGHLNVLPADFDATLFDRAAQPSRDSAQLFSAFSALVGFVFAFSATLLTAPQRRRLITDLHLDGYAPSTIARVMLFDAIMLGAVASLLGLLIGDQVSRHVLQADPGYLTYTFAVGSQRVVTWEAVAVALGGGMVAAIVAVLSPLRSFLMSLRPGVAGGSGLRGRGDDGGHSLRSAGAAAALAATTLILTFAPQLALLGMATLTAALLLALPAVVAAMARALDTLARHAKGAAFFLVAAALRAPANRSRALAVAAIGAVAVMASVALEGSRLDLERGLDATALEVDSMADIWISPRSEANTLATMPFRDELADGLRQVPGVRAVRAYGGFLDWGERRVWVLAPSREAAAPLASAHMTAAERERARERLRAGGWVVLSRALADERGLDVGDTLTLPTAVPLRMRVAALSSNLGWPPGAIVLNADDYARAWDSDDPSAYHLMLAPNARPSAVRRRVVRLLGPRSPFTVETAAERRRRHFASTREALGRLAQIRTLVLAAAVLAMATAMAGMIWQRRRGFASLKVDGLTDGELWRGLVLESAALVGATCLLGAVFGLYGQVVLSRALANITGFPLVFSLGGTVAVACFALVTAVAVAMIALPGYLAARVSPAITLQD